MCYSVYSETMFTKNIRQFSRHIITDRNKEILSIYQRGGFNFRKKLSQTQYRPQSTQATQTPDKNLSYLFHPGVLPLTDTTIGQIFETAVERWPNRDCIVSIHQNVRLTYSEALRRANILAAGLRKLGLRKGDCIGLWGPNDMEWFIAYVAAVRAGLIMVGINPAYQQVELEFCLKKVQLQAVIAPEVFRMKNYASMLLEAKTNCPALKHLIIYSENIVSGVHRISDVEALATKRDVEAICKEQNSISSYDGSNIQFTSGTTGKPKAPILSHRSYVNNSRQGAERFELHNAHHKICVNVPFFHAFGMITQVSAWHAGSTLILPAPTFNPVNSLEAIIQEKCSAVFGTPTMWTIYGLTETTAISFQSLPNERRELTETTVGHLGDHLEAMVVDENGLTLPLGTPGELWIRGYSTMIGYWGDKENTGNTLTEDGWLKTGDQFVLRSDGYGQIVGRLKDMVIRGGENIFPKEIEDFFETHPAVLEAHVVGVHDDVYGEEVCACLRLKKGAVITKDELKYWSKGKIAHFKIPKYIEFRDTFPCTTSGKVQKYLLREELERKNIVPSKLN
ncbi:medium-chain acyl-CoA ligase ACSF2, mitochondrial isoform X2 [Belonocnema kinseyi]|uniref:medium-chain acyl-CoA ligase ACSF2, mitochondrial isoform X2 n=1 Tax=Belonocnema kinseyi TaxID=2817044 RepID=UPI00143DA98F|nr:medium-chain acyl-CoA ligase ACSF2, mitochondrial isoform X2 [Belonocnema kinseyi]